MHGTANSHSFYGVEKPQATKINCQKWEKQDVTLHIPEMLQDICANMKSKFMS